MRTFQLTFLIALMLTARRVDAQHYMPGQSFVPANNGHFIQPDYTATEFDGDDDLAARVKKLEAEMKKAKKAVQPGHSDSSMKVFGRIHVDHWGIPEDSPGVIAMEGENPQDRWGFRRMRFGVSGKLPSNMLYKIEMEFAGGNDSEFRDAYLGWDDLPVFHTLLIGNQKRPYGLDHLNSSRYNVFLERPFVIESFNQDARRLGVCSYGLSEDQRWNWRYGVYTLELMQNDGQHINDHAELEFAGRLANTIWYDECSGGRGYAHWAVSGTIAEPDPAGNGTSRFRHRPEARTRNRWLNTGNIPGIDYYNMVGVEGVLNLGAMQIVGEYQYMSVNREPGRNDFDLHGGYVYVSYFLTGEHTPWSRKSGTLGRVKPFENAFWVTTCDGCRGHGLGAWQVAARYSYADFNDDDILGGVGESLTFGMNWWWTPYARLQFNYIIGDIEDRDVNNDPAKRKIVSGNYGITGFRAMVDF